MREDVGFDSRGDRCAAWVYPARGGGPAPCVILAHGFAGIRGQRLDVYAARFQAAGLAAVVFDYRGFGDSDGTPRQVVDNQAQLDDWRAAIAFARELDGVVDPDRIALWGTSTSGGHVVKLAAEDARIAAVVVQMPFADGFAQFRSMPLRESLRLLWAGLRDKVADLRGREPLMIPAAGRPGSAAVVTSPDALSGLARITPSGVQWENRVAARFALTTTFYRPGRDARRVRCPVLVCVADGDLVIPAAAARRIAFAAPRGELRRYGCGHFSMYDGAGFDAAVVEQARFLRQSMGLAGAPMDGDDEDAAPPRLRAVGP